MKKIACVGMTAIDVITTPVTGLPPLNTVYHVDKIRMFVGGCAANAALDLAKLGLPARLSCRLGDDIFGQFVMGELTKHGVNTQSVTLDPQVDSAVTIVCLDPVEKERRCLTTSESNDNFDTEDISDEILAESDIIFMAGMCQLKKFDGKHCGEFVKKAHDLGKFVAMDVMWDFEGVWMPKVADALPYLDLFMPSYDEVVQIIGETEPEKMVEKLHALGPKNVVVKLGKQGAIVKEGDDGPYYVPIFPCDPEDIVDVIGAGDSSCAGTLAGLATGMNLHDAVAFGQAVASYCIRAQGTYNGIRPMEEILDAMKKVK
ncbi:carbohydrate kinase family protein [Zongyangia hominis]|uniref:Carbohydrate kinase family protein n=1 Tax=Zongyangia hominis TaxID=2763677 RepID=A0A926I7A5_9FIRM|nr:carbohydrate kinase family protein [Zongyangia hominis]MBC8570884.1 carbohydrate kinase family protein [Zongyangia hominis]